jgi:hypothetical protein
MLLNPQSTAKTMSNELTAQLNQYTPSLDNEGNYVDTLPTKSAFVKGIKCGCGTATWWFDGPKFKTHCKSVMHQKWIQILNQNKNNHLSELSQLRETVRQQQLLIAERDKRIIDMEQVIRSKDAILDRYKWAASYQPTTEANLLDIDS